MEKEMLIPVMEVCASHHIETSFLLSLQDSGLIEVTTVEHTRFLPVDQLKPLEKILRFYYEMDINLEGIEAIHHLLVQIGELQAENASLKNRLRIYDVEE